VKVEEKKDEKKVTNSNQTLANANVTAQAQTLTQLGKNETVKVNATVNATANATRLDQANATKVAAVNVTKTDLISANKTAAANQSVNANKTANATGVASTPNTPAATPAKAKSEEAQRKAAEVEKAAKAAKDEAAAARKAADEAQAKHNRLKMDVKTKHSGLNEHDSNKTAQAPNTANLKIFNNILDQHNKAAEKAQNATKAPEPQPVQKPTEQPKQAEANMTKPAVQPQPVQANKTAVKADNATLSQKAAKVEAKTAVNATANASKQA